MSDLLPSNNNYDDISNRVRLFCAERFYELERTLRPWVDGSFGDVSPPHVQGYISVLRELGRLYEAQKRPRTDEERIPVKQVEAMLAAVRDEADARMAMAVAEAEAKVRHELEASVSKSIESAKQTALAKLTQIRERTQQ